MKIAKGVGVVLCAVFATVVQSQSAFVPGTHYQDVTPVQPTTTGEQIEVVEMFWYGCPHCFDFESYISKWLETKPANVAFVKIPAVFSQSWEPHARAYYTAETLGITDKIHRPLFNAIHTDKQPLNTEDSLARFFVSQGVTDADFRKAYHSFGVDGKVSRARQLSRAYGITGVPAIIVNGKYRSSANTAGSYTELLKLVDELVDTERKSGSKEAVQ